MPAENDTNDLLLCLNSFMTDKLLFWIEAMNLIGAVFECSPLLRDAKNWLNRVRNTLSCLLRLQTIKTIVNVVDSKVQVLMSLEECKS